MPFKVWVKWGYLNLLGLLERLASEGDHYWVYLYPFLIETGKGDHSRRSTYLLVQYISHTKWRLQGDNHIKGTDYVVPYSEIVR